MPDLVFATRGAAEVIRAQAQINERARELNSIYRDDARAARELEQAATRIFKSAQNPAKQFNEEMGKLHGNFKTGKINAEQYEKGVKRLEKAYQETNTIGGKLKGTLGNMFGSDMLAKVATYAAGLGSITTAVMVLKSEYQAAMDLIDKANRTQLDVSQARNVVIRNLVGETPESIKRVLGQTQALAGELKLPESVISTAFADALSASGGKVPDALNAVRLAGQFMPDQPSEMGEFAGSLIDLQKVTGSSDQRVNFGLLAKISQLSRVATPGRIAQNAPKGLIGAAGFGFSAQEAAALYSTLTFAAGDKTGANSATALLQLSGQLSGFAPSAMGDADLQKLKDRMFFTDPASNLGRTLQGQIAGAEQGRAAAAAFAALPTGQKLQALQQDPALAQQFLADASFEQAARVPIRHLLTDPSSPAARSFRDNMGSIPGNVGLMRMSDEALANFRLNPLEAQAASSRALHSLQEQLRLNAPQNLGLEQREVVLEALQRLGGSNIGSRARLFMGQLGDARVGVNAGEATDLLQFERDRLLRGPMTSISAGPGAPGVIHHTPPTVEDKKNAELLGDVIEVLKQQLDAQKETNRKLDESGLTVSTD